VLNKYEWTKWEFEKTILNREDISFFILEYWDVRTVSPIPSTLFPVLTVSNGLSWKSLSFASKTNSLISPSTCSIIEFIILSKEKSPIVWCSMYDITNLSLNLF